MCTVCVLCVDTCASCTHTHTHTHPWYRSCRVPGYMCTGYPGTLPGKQWTTCRLDRYVPIYCTFSFSKFARVVYTIICNSNTCNILCLNGLLHLHRSSGDSGVCPVLYLLLPALFPLFRFFFPLPVLLLLLLLLSFLLFDTLPPLLLPLPLPTLDETRARINR